MSFVQRGVFTVCGVAAVGAAIGLFATRDDLLPAHGPAPGAGRFVQDQANSARIATTVGVPPALQDEANRVAPPGADGAATAVAAAWPPDDAPVTEVIARLEAAAVRGDVRANCRIGLELSRCYQIDSKRRQAEAAGGGPGPWSSMLGANAGDEAPPGTRDAFPQAGSGRCAGVEPYRYDEAWRYLLRAADGGNVAAMGAFAIAPPLPPNRAADFIDAWGAYREQAPRFLQRAIDSGDVRALYVGWYVSVTATSAGGGRVFERDPYQALVYARSALPYVDRSARALLDRSIVALETELGPARAAEASQASKRLRETVFAAATPTLVSRHLGIPEPGACAR